MKINSKENDKFIGTPWNSEPNDDFNSQAYWNDYYDKILLDEKLKELEWAIIVNIENLKKALESLDELPAGDSKRFLYAGCGISQVPYILSLWGFAVNAIDSSEAAIDIVSNLELRKRDLALSIYVLDPNEKRTTITNDPKISINELKKYQSTNGTLKFLVMDWFSDKLRPKSFDFVYCRNALRCSTKPYWRKSLKRFNELLKPGGTLILETLNAIGIQDEVRALFKEYKFVKPKLDESRNKTNKYIIDDWPTG
ncbi:MAG: methyltransferase domain-containing protein [Calditrichaeota bacterium]|nr:MAG: methyltransferase domain-containing protein [Calditrichota bacterium]MBL1207407.1 methyltransferase domain-containing protein [Calditrichota bacterium]NOG47239.1 class I SAM-dependent methyltransferase [Calditrichota bacterium]